MARTYKHCRLEAAFPSARPLVVKFLQELLGPSMRRQPMGSQIRTFRHILRNVLRVLGAGIPIVQDTFLLRVGVRVQVPGIRFRPRRSLEGSLYQEVQLMLTRGGYWKAVRHPFNTKLPLLDCPLQPW